MLPVTEVGQLEIVAGGVEVATDLVAGTAEANVLEEGLVQEPTVVYQ